MKTCILYNPLAGRGHGKETAEKLAAPAEGYATFAYGNEEPWPICLIGTTVEFTSAE